MKTLKNLAKLAFLIALLTGCAHENSKEMASAAIPSAAVPSAAVPSAAIVRPSGYVMVREYVDSVKTDHGDEYRKVQYGWDYAQGVAVQRISSMDGKLISTQSQPNLTLETTPNELEFAIALVRQHPELADIAQQADALIYGGFSLTTDPSEESSDAANVECGAKSRCIHIIISGGQDGEKSLGHAIVNLASGRVVDAHYRGEKTFVSKVK